MPRRVRLLLVLLVAVACIATLNVWVVRRSSIPNGRPSDAAVVAQESHDATGSSPQTAVPSAVDNASGERSAGVSSAARDSDSRGRSVPATDVEATSRTAGEGAPPTTQPAATAVGAPAAPANQTSDRERSRSSWATSHPDRRDSSAADAALSRSADRSDDGGSSSSRSSASSRSADEESGVRTSSRSAARPSSPRTGPSIVSADAVLRFYAGAPSRVRAGRPSLPGSLRAASGAEAAAPRVAAPSGPSLPPPAPAVLVQELRAALSTGALPPRPDPSPRVPAPVPERAMRPPRAVGLADDVRAALRAELGRALQMYGPRGPLSVVEWHTGRADDMPPLLPMLDSSTAVRAAVLLLTGAPAPQRCAAGPYGARTVWVGAMDLGSGPAFAEAVRARTARGDTFSALQVLPDAGILFDGALPHEALRTAAQLLSLAGRTVLADPQPAPRALQALWGGDLETFLRAAAAQHGLEVTVRSVAGGAVRVVDVRRAVRELAGGSALEWDGARARLRLATGRRAPADDPSAAWPVALSASAVLAAQPTDDTRARVFAALLALPSPALGDGTALTHVCLGGDGAVGATLCSEADPPPAPPSALSSAASKGAAAGGTGNSSSASSSGSSSGGLTGTGASAKIETGARVSDALWPLLSAVLPAATAQRVLLSGGDLVYAAAKVASARPAASVLVTAGGNRTADPLFDSLQLPNIVRGTRAPVLGAGRADIAVFGLEWWVDFAALSKRDFSRYVARTAALAGTVFLRVPEPDTLSRALAAALAPGAEEADWASTGALQGLLHELTPLADVQALETEAGWVLQLRAKVPPSAADKEAPSSAPGAGFTLADVLQLDPLPADRAALMRAYLRLPLYAEMSPERIHWCAGQLRHASQPHQSADWSSGTEPGAESAALAHWEARQSTLAAAVAEALLARMTGPMFSFLEYGAGLGDVALAVAQRFPNASVIAVEGHADLADRAERRLDALAVPQVVLCRQGVTADLLTKLYECPEFMRYQLLHGALDLLLALPAPQFSLLIGQALSLGLTTFFTFPSPALVSVALSTLYPDRFPPPAQRPYAAASHPLPALREYDKAVLSVASVTGRNAVRVRASRVSLLDETQGLLRSDEMSAHEQAIRAGWSLLRADALNVTRSVNHHFDYAKDGHRRKYTLRVERSEADVLHDMDADNPAALVNTAAGTSRTPVRLLRAEDEFVIPYERIHGITLIALMRMGISDARRQRFYEQFIRMPLYEDMAPWNIIFSGGQLRYIDYDTRDVTLDKYVPLAYQVLSALANFKRTVEDAQRCGPKGTNGRWNFPYLSDCVGGAASTARGPCTSSAYPVPCGDGTCRPTYIECLRALLDMEQERERTRAFPGGCDNLFFALLAFVADRVAAAQAALQATVDAGDLTFTASGIVVPGEPPSSTDSRSAADDALGWR